jgi:hypothetical protein
VNHIIADFGEDWFDSPNVYKMLVENCRDDGKIVELGAWKGRSSAFLVVEAYNKSPKIEVHIVDTWGGNPFDGSEDQSTDAYSKFISNMSLLARPYQAYRMTTNEAVGFFKDESLDAVFIDADHSYEAVKMDIKNWMPKVRKGGILAGHDYSSAWSGVIRAVDEIFPDSEKIEFCWVKKC